MATRLLSAGFSPRARTSPTRPGSSLRICHLIPTDSNELMAPLHNRMPVILRRENEQRWLAGDLDSDAMREILAPYPAGGMEAYPVSERVNRPGVDDEGLIRPLKGL